MIFGAFAGGGKNSLIDARGVLVKGRLLDRPRMWADPQPMHGFKYDVLAPATRVCMAWESWAVCLVVATAKTRGLAEAYICDQEGSSSV